MTTFSADFMVDPRRLRVLREVGVRGTVTAAAAGLHLTPSAVSQQIAALSRDLDAPLLEKVGRGVRLTPAARLLLEHASAVQAQVERARADLAALAEGRLGSVTVAGFATAISGLIAPALAELSRGGTAISITAIDLEPPDVFTELDRGGVDVVVAVDHRGVPARSDPHYFRADLLADTLDAALPATHRLAGADRIELRDLADDVFVGAAPMSSCSEVTLAACAAAGFNPQTRHYSGDWNAVAGLVSAGAGVALVPRLAQPLHMPGVVVRPLAGGRAARNIFVAVRNGSQHDATVAAVLRTLHDVAAPLAEASNARDQAPSTTPRRPAARSGRRALAASARR